MKLFNTVYVVDDDLVFHFILKKLFAKADSDFKVNYFLNGIEAIEAIKVSSNLPDLILLDINMPISDGWQFLQDFRDWESLEKENIKIYIISSSDDPSDLQKANFYKNEVQLYCNKPLTMVEFKEIFFNSDTTV
ncbi:MAG: two-component system chemotaxis response regulator CheY [Flavobacterium sp.]|jgi:two-component system chemotaxis response regulator CheY